MMKYLSVPFFLFLLLLGSCGISESNRFKAKPKALGIMNEIVVLTDDNLWKGMIFDSVDYYFAGYFPLTPRPEPIFDIRQFDLEDINNQPLKKELRTYLILSDLSNESSEIAQFVRNDLGEQGLKRFKSDPEFRTSIGRDKWANGQLLIYIFGSSIDDLANAIVANFEAISARINEHDYEQLYQSVYARGTNVGLTNRFKERFGAEISIPLTYVVAVDKPEEVGLAWLRTDYKEGITNLVLRQYTYDSESKVSKSFIKDDFNRFGKKYVSSSEPNTFMVINDQDLPILEFERSINGHYVKELRGIWEMENDFMGGPFLSYAVVNEQQGKVLLIHGFVYSPGKEKREALQQLDLIVKNINWE